MIARIVLIFSLLFAAGASLQQQQPPRDAVRTATGTASISGIVLVDGDPAAPARRVRVTLRDLSGAVPGQTATTDDRGGFTFRGLPSGRYELQGFKSAYLRASYGASRPERAGTPVVVSEGAAVTGLTMSIVRGGVITGAMRDARDRPMPGVGVRVLRIGYNAVTGERTLSAPGGGATTLTDDRGEYRAYGLPPGSYLVFAPGPSPGRGNEPIRRITADDIRQALQAGQSATSPAPGAAPATPASAPVRVNHAPVFHPGVTDIAAAAVVPLGLGEERAGVDITYQLVPTARISGTVSSLTGPLPSMLSVRLVPSQLQGEPLTGTVATSQVSADGRYAFASVAPGSYVIRASVGWARGSAPTGPTQWASADVYVSGDDLVVPLTLQPGIPVRGRVVFEGTSPAAAELESLSFALVPPGTGGRAQAFGGGRVDADRRFTFANVIPDSYWFTTTWSAPGAQERWWIKASVANGRDAFDTPLRVNANEPVEWTVTFTDRPATLTGSLVNPGGRAATEYYVLVFSTDRRYWTPGSRRIRMTRPATDGTFTIRGLPPGEYLLAAPLDLETGEWNDPALMEQLAGASVKVTLREAETTTQNYRMGGG
jgi:hypothetical protein